MLPLNAAAHRSSIGISAIAVSGAVRNFAVNDDIPFDKTFALSPGRVEEVMPAVRRLLANNPSPFTYKGTVSYIVGRGQVAILDPGPEDALVLGDRGRTRRPRTFGLHRRAAPEVRGRKPHRREVRTRSRRAGCKGRRERGSECRGSCRDDEKTACLSPPRISKPIDQKPASLPTLRSDRRLFKTLRGLVPRSFLPFEDPSYG